MDMPQRPRPHIQEDNSRKYFNNKIPQEWTVEDIDNDYGVDVLIEIFNGQNATGSTFISQLKSTDKEFQGDTVSVQIDRKTLNYLKQRLEPALIVLYVSSDKEAYWIWLREISINWAVNQQSHLIHISKERKLSTANWIKIEEFVTTVRMGKLKAGEQFNF